MNSVLLFKLILKKPRFRGLVSYVLPNHFQNPADRELWRILSRIVKEYGDIPSEEAFVSLVQEEVKNSPAKESIVKRLQEIVDLEIKDVDEKILAHLLEEYFVRVKVLELGDRLCSSVDDKKIDKARLLDYLQQVLVQLRQGVLSDGNVSEILENKAILERIISRIDDEEDEMLSLFLPSIDRILNGGIRRGTLSVVLGATSVGKTMFLVYLSAVARVQGFRVLYLSLEDTDKIVQERFDSLFFGSKVYVDYVIAKKQFLDRFGGGIWVEYNFGIDIEYIRSCVQRYKELLGGLDVLVVDYGDLVAPVRRTGDEFVDQGVVFEELMHIAETEGLYVVTASQATRASLSARNLTLQHIGRSFRKVQVAHYVLALAQSPEEEEKGLIRFVVLKNKFGPRGVTISCAVARARHWFRELSS